MRITEGMMTANYNRNLQTNLSNLSASNMKLTSKRQFNHVSEDPARAAKAFSVRTQIARNEQYSSVVANASSELKTASDNIMNLTSILETVIEKSARAGGTMDETAMTSIAEELKGLKEEVLSLMNVQYGDKYLFGGTNVSGSPFTVDDSGALLYNGKPVDEYDPDDPDTHFTSNKDVYLDVGYGSTGLNGNNKGIKISTSGAEVLGYGTDDSGRVNNLYSIIDDIEKKLRAGDQDGAMDALENLKDKQSYVTTATAEIGARQNMLERTKDRLSSELLTLQDTQDNLEGVDMEKEAINYQSLKTAWQATLQIGSALILPSIFDFIN